MASAVGSSATGVKGAFEALGAFSTVGTGTLALVPVVAVAVSPAGVTSAAGGSDSGLDPAWQTVLGDLCSTRSKVCVRVKAASGRTHIAFCVCAGKPATIDTSFQAIFLARTTHCSTGLHTLNYRHEYHGHMVLELTLVHKFKMYQKCLGACSWTRGRHRAQVYSLTCTTFNESPVVVLATQNPAGSAEHFAVVPPPQQSSVEAHACSFVLQVGLSCPCT